MDKERLIMGIIGIVLSIFGSIYLYRERNVTTNENWRLTFIAIGILFLISISIYLLWKSIG